MDYERGLTELKDHLQGDARREFNVHEARLRENLDRERRYGSTETTRAERAAILDALNRLALAHLNVSFNDLCQPTPPSGAYPTHGPAPTSDTRAIDPAALHRTLAERLDLEEFRTLCTDLGLPYDHLRGEGLPAKARELVAYMQRRHRLPELIEQLLHERPDIKLDLPSSNLQSPIPNPFGDTGRITDPTRFFDREELLRQVFEELAKGVNLSLVGASQVGKSSLLSMVCAGGPERLNLPQDAFAYLSLQWVRDEDDFYAALADALELPEPSRGYRLIRTLRDRQRVLCLDEIEKMTWDGFTRNLRSELRGLADGPAAPLKLVVASRSPLARLFPDSPQLDSPLAGVCHPLDVGPFPPAVARDFLAQRLRGTGITFSENEINTILQETGGHPAQLQRAAADLYRHHAMPKGHNT
jgi:hypothetical protein